MKVETAITLRLEGDERFRFQDKRGGARLLTFEAESVVWVVGSEQATVWAVLVYANGTRAKNGQAFIRPLVRLRPEVQEALAGAVRAG